jgi:hypothetical protein
VDAGRLLREIVKGDAVMGEDEPPAGTQHAGHLPRQVALELWTAGSAWFSNEQERKGRIREGMLADLAVLSQDFFSIDAEEIKAIESVLNSAAELLLFSVNSISSGTTESQGEVTMRLSSQGRIVNGVGADPDIVVASAKAYLNALNKLQSKVERVNPQV